MSSSTDAKGEGRFRLVWLLVAAFLVGSVTTGGAFAAGMIRSDDIVDGQVRRVDLAGDAVTGGKVRDGSIGSNDLTSPAWTSVAPNNPGADACDAGQVSTFCGIQQPPSTLNWSNFGGGWQPVRFRRDVTGLVEIEGVARGSFSFPTAFLLPEGYRPLHAHVFVVSCADDDGGEYVGGRVSVHPDGSVHWEVGDTCNPYSYISFDGVRFRTD